MWNLSKDSEKIRGELILLKKKSLSGIVLNTFKAL